MNSLEKAVLDIIEKRYKCKYIGKIKITKLEPGGFKLKMDLGCPGEWPIQLVADLDEENFLKFVEQELISRQLHKVQFFKGITYEQGKSCQQN